MLRYFIVLVLLVPSSLCAQTWSNLNLPNEGSHHSETDTYVRPRLSLIGWDANSIRSTTSPNPNDARGVKQILESIFVIQNSSEKLLATTMLGKAN